MRRAPFAGQSVKDVAEISLDVDEFNGGEHALENIKPAAPIGREDVRVHPAVGRKAHRASVAKRERSFLAIGQVDLHRCLLVSVIGYRCTHGLALTVKDSRRIMPAIAV